MEDMKRVLITSETLGKPVVLSVPKVAKAIGNVPTSEEFNTLVEAFNRLIDTLRDKGIIA